MKMLLTDQNMTPLNVRGEQMAIRLELRSNMMNNWLIIFSYRTGNIEQETNYTF
mgnify:CR=1 FL=1